MSGNGGRGRAGRWVVLAILLLVGGFGLASGTASAGSGDIATGAGIFTEATIALTAGILLIGAFSLQLARNYFLRVLDKFTLRLGADVWWLAYILIRDGLAFMALLLGFEMFYVGTYADYAIAVPFMPLAMVIVAATLLVKLVWDTDEEEKKNRLVTTLLGLATFMYIFGALTVTENIAGYSAAGYVTTASGAVTTATGGSDLWTLIFNAFSSTVNVPLATYSFYGCFAGLAAIGLYAFLHVVRPSKGAGKKTPEKATTAAPATRDSVVAPAAGKTG